jgi:hypothetical protein
MRGCWRRGWFFRDGRGRTIHNQGRGEIAVIEIRVKSDLLKLCFDHESDKIFAIAIERC